MTSILIIDDDPDIVESIKVVLNSAQFEVATARSGKEGLEKTKKYPPDLIILDIMMETLSKGLEIAQELKQSEKTRNIPILMLTSIKEKLGIGFRDNTGDEPWLPIDDYCEKPIKAPALLKKVKDLLHLAD